MKLTNLISTLTLRYPGLVQVSAWGETSLFYNPQNLFKRGTYCITFKEKDGENDSASALYREEVDFRMNFKINKDTFLMRFRETSLPTRPAKGNIIKLKSGNDYDPTSLDTLLPHPVYGWMGWVSITNPSQKSINEIFDAGLLDESYHHAVACYDEKRRNLLKSKDRVADDDADSDEKNKRKRRNDDESYAGNNSNADSKKKKRVKK